MMGEPDKKAEEKSDRARPRPKAEPRPSLAPLDFEEAFESLLAVKPEADSGSPEAG